jgi:hypothetical protein
LSTLNLLIEAMQEVIELDKTIDMSWYFKEYEPEDTDTIHTCNTAACVLGYAALKVPGDKYEALRKLRVMLEREIGHGLTHSIIASKSTTRIECALAHKNGDWVAGYQHLVSNYPTAQNALDYLLKVKEIVNT